MQRVINFSGGRTSAYMTILEYKPGDIVLFCDTGREHPKTYKFINDFEAHENIPIIRLTYEGGFERLLPKYQAVPNKWKRFCTKELKVKTARRYLRSLGLMRYENMIGFRADEKVRVKRHKNYWKQVTTTFPLYDMGIRKNNVLEYWKTKPYDLEVPPILGNCDACFMKGKAAIIAIYQKFPELAEKWINDEKSGHTYLKGISHQQMLDAANNLKRQYDLFEIQPELNCACTT